MDIFIHGIPTQATNGELTALLRPHLHNLQIFEFMSHKPKNRGFGFLHIGDKVKGDIFLSVFAPRTDLKLSPKFHLRFTINKQQDGGARLRDERLREQRVKEPPLDKAMEALSIGPEHGNMFDTVSLSCGAWEYRDSTAMFVSYYTQSNQGKLLVGRTSAVLLLYPQFGGQSTLRIDFVYRNIDMVVTSSGAYPSLIISCFYSPKLYSLEDQQLMLLRLNSKSRPPKNIRITSLDNEHGEVAACCFTYRIVLSNGHALETVRYILKAGVEMPPTMPFRVQVIKPTTSFAEERRTLTNALSTGFYSTFPFTVKFQALKLALNGKLPPATVLRLLPVLSTLLQTNKSEAPCAQAVQSLYNELPIPGPHHEEFSIEVLEERIVTLWSSYNAGESVYLTVQTHSHLALIHHIRVTPTGIYLEGPHQEVSNRILRKYCNYLDSFVRVTFSDEDGERIGFEWNTVLDEVYARIKGLLDSNISICDRRFSFLGFSSSSLKSQTAWFMAPFWHSKTQELLLPPHVIYRIGDFSSFRSPAKCAARIGQAFTDTNGFVTVHAKAASKIPDVERNSRNFSDGCGTISKELAAKVTSKFSRLQMRVKPIAFQIRFQGAKGVLSVDTELPGDSIRYRDSMWKFEARETEDLEICSMADRPLPLFLNRPLINVLEDIGVPHKGFLEIADEVIKELHQSVSSPINASIFLETERVGDGAGIPLLMRRMNDINIPFLEDRFLRSVVEMAAFVRLRDMKYKGRMRVKNGIKLMGIMDETGYLKEGEIYCSWVGPDGHLKRVTGEVAITRSPTNHPGDVQLVNAVKVSQDSRLRETYNVVIFSQHGQRDLPSMLGGGDLDGDQFDIIWDPRLLPRLRPSFPPADYPRLPPLDIGREVQINDIARHFVDYMKNDNVGMLSSHLLSLSDRLDDGTRDSLSIQIADLISTALDFSKTGIKADMTKMPVFDRSMKPDFMAPGPKVKVAKNATLEFENNEKDIHDPVSMLDPEQRPTVYYESDKILGKLYRLVDEKGFYEQLREQSQNSSRSGGEDISSYTMHALEEYVSKAAQGIQFKSYMDLARDIRDNYETNVNDIMHTYCLHSSIPLHEVEVVSGCVLGSVFIRRLKETVSDMRTRFAEDVAYTRTRIRADHEGNEEEALPRAIACFYVSVEEPGLVLGNKANELVSFKYVAAALCLEELEKFHGGLLKRL